MGPMFTRSATHVPWSEAWERRFTFRSRFEETVEVFKRSDDGKTLALPRGAVPVVHVDERDLGVSVAFTSNFKPQKPEQLGVIAQAMALLAKDEQFLIAAPTGWGKTFVGTEIAGRVGRRFCVITTKEDILYQWRDAIQATLGLATDEIGLWRGDSAPLPSHKAVVGLVQSLSKGPERYGGDAYLGFGLVICDEVHRMAAESFSQCMWHFPAKYRIGLSATPTRKDGKDPVFLWHIGPVKVSATLEVLIPKVLLQATGWVVPRDKMGQQIPHDFGRLGVLMKPITRNLARNALIVQILVSTLKAGRSTIAFSDSMEHLEILSDLLLQAGMSENQIGFYVGLPHARYGGVPGQKHRKEHQRQERAKQSIRPIVLATYQMASEATNLPWLDTCVLMTPKADVVQIVGRIRREYPDKKPPVVIDLQDRDSRVLAHYCQSRRKWYEQLGAQLVVC